MSVRLILMTKRLFLSLALVSTAHAQWEQLPPLPEPNGGFICGHSNGKIVVLGGTNWEGGKKNWLKVAHFYDPVNRTWRSSHNMSEPVAYAAAFQGEHHFAFMGGFDGLRSAMFFGWAEEPKPVQHFNFGQPDDMVLSASGMIDEKLIVVGGLADPAKIESVHRKTVILEWGKEERHFFRTENAGSTPGYRLQHNFKVTRLVDYPGKPFATAGSAVVGDELFVFGGMNYDAAARLPANSVEAYAFSPEKNVWRALKPLSAANRGLTAVALDDGHIYIAGGYRDDFTAEAVIYDVKADSYWKAPPIPYAAMVGLVKLDGFVYCLGGEDKKQSRTDKFFRVPVSELLK
ncbi:MAG: hypothetical protein NTX35_19835 [Verrucomicrobia bacterium]|nr:hypothetical protein [Verrucomicrobiota bacterium]